MSNRHLRIERAPRQVQLKRDVFGRTLPRASRALGLRCWVMHACFHTRRVANGIKVENLPGYEYSLLRCCSSAYRAEVSYLTAQTGPDHTDHNICQV
eukprot:4043570-Pleurochrysis_carterae.AAC.5